MSQHYVPQEPVAVDSCSIAGYEWVPPNLRIQRLFNDENFAGSEAWAEICALLGDILVIQLAR